MVASVNWQQQAANLMHLATNIPASPVFMDHFLPDAKKPTRHDSSTTLSSSTSSPSSSMHALSSATSPASSGIEKEAMEEVQQGPELTFRL